MLQQDEVFGTILTVLFTLMVIAFLKVFWVDLVAPTWVAIVFTVLFGATAIWACVKVGIYWYYRIKNYMERKKK